MRREPDERPWGLVDHLERTLGRIKGGVHAVDAEGSRLPFQIVEFEAAERLEDVVYSTLGLSRGVLTQPSGRTIRQELVVVARRGAPAQSWLTVLGEGLLTHGKAVTRGDVSGPAGPVMDGSALTGFYFTVPTYWEDELAAFDGPDGEVVIVWAVPVTSSEMSFVRTHGWRAFEDLLVAAQPDAADPHRMAVLGVH